MTAIKPTSQQKLRSSMKKKPQAPGEMERLARELLGLVDEPLEVSLKEKSAQKRSRDEPDQPTTKCPEVKRSLMLDLSAAADKTSKNAGLSVLLLSRETQGVEAREAKRDPPVPSLPSLPASSLPLHQASLAFDFKNIDLSRIWTQSQQTARELAPLRQESSSPAVIRGTRNPKGRYIASSNQSSRHLDSILSKLISPKRIN